MLTELILTETGCVERDKVDCAVRILREYEGLALEQDPRGYMVGYSGGKDSTVLAQIFREANVKHFLFHNMTGIDPPELVYFKRRQFAQWRDEGLMCVDMKPPESLIQILRRKKSIPSRMKRFCCEGLKEYKKPDFINCIGSYGVRKAESINRSNRRNELEIIKKAKDYRLFSFDNHENRRQFETCYATGFREVRINPVAFWEDTDVWDFIHDRKLPYCELYDEGFCRLGCVGCPMAGDGRKQEFDRWPGLRRVWEIAFRAVWEAREAAGMGWWRGISSISDLWDWWMEDLPDQDNEIDGQIELEDYS